MQWCNKLTITFSCHLNRVVPRNAFVNEKKEDMWPICLSLHNKNIEKGKNKQFDNTILDDHNYHQADAINLFAFPPVAAVENTFVNNLPYGD